MHRSGVNAINVPNIDVLNARKLRVGKLAYDLSNPVIRCPHCEQIMECQISNAKLTCGVHNLFCKTFKCGYSIPLETVMHQKEQDVEASTSCSTGDGYAPKHKALEDRLRAVEEKAEGFENFLITFSKIVALKDD